MTAQCFSHPHVSKNGRPPHAQPQACQRITAPDEGVRRALSGQPRGISTNRFLRQALQAAAFLLRLEYAHSMVQDDFSTLRNVQESTSPSYDPSCATHN